MDGQRSMFMPERLGLGKSGGGECQGNRVKEYVTNG